MAGCSGTVEPVKDGPYVVIDGLDLSGEGQRVTVDPDAFETMEYRSPEEQASVERQLRMRLLDRWAGRCYRAARPFNRLAAFWEGLGDRAYGEWERKAYWK